MRPPICDVCDERFEPSEGALLKCKPTASDLDWRARSQGEGFVGHPPDTAWFCGAHAGEARALAAAHTRGEVIARLREQGSEPAAPAPPVPFEAEDRGEVPLATRFTEIGDLVGALKAAMPALAEYAGIGGAEVTHTTKRSYSPMDGSFEPDCPYEDEHFYLANSGDVNLFVRFEVAYWNPDDAARSYVSCVLRGAGEKDFRLAAWSPASKAPFKVEGGQVTGVLPPFLAKRL